MILKKSVLFASLFFVLMMFLGIASAQGNCNIVQRADCSDTNEHIVMGLSSDTNAHGQFPDLGQAGYAYVLCCGIEGITTCTASENKIIGLSDATNAHAEIPGLDNYDVDVCYNGLECIYEDSRCSNQEYNIPLMSLSADTNAHIGGFSDYNIKICCKEVAPSGTAYWINVKGGAIDTADIGDSVGASVYIPEGGLQGKNIEYTIYKKKAILPGDKITTITGPAQLNNIGWVFWIAGKISENEMKAGDYYFKAKVLPNGDEIKSGDLSVTEPEKNALPVANIFSPDHGAWFKTNQLITFSMNGSYDVDDAPSSWRVFWNLDDSKTSNVLRWDFQDSYSQIGQKEIGFMFTRGVGTRKRTGFDYTSIMVCQEPGIYIFVNISQPINNGEIIMQEGPLVAKTHGTYAWNCQTTETHCTPDCITVDGCDDLFCKDITNNIEKANWTLYQANVVWNYTVWISEEKDWKDNIDENIFSVKPEQLSDAEYWAIELLVKMGANTGQTSRVFKIYFQGDVCSADGTYWTDTGESTMNNCKIADYEHGCCPDRYSCEGSIGNSRCVRSDEWRCGDFTSLGENECESAEDWIAIESVRDFFDGEHTCMNGGGSDINIVGYTEFGYPIWIDDCRCEWKDNECVSAYDQHQGSPLSDDTPNRIGTCKIREDTNDDCSDGFLEIKYIANFVWDNENVCEGSFCDGSNDNYILVDSICRYDPKGKSGLCTSTTNKIPCPEQIKLMFFSFWGAIATLSAIAFVYVWLLFGRAPKKKEEIKSK